MRFYLLRWRDNAKFARKLKASWAKLESRITQRHVEDGFLGWARYTAERKRTLTLLDVRAHNPRHPELHVSPRPVRAPNDLRRGCAASASGFCQYK